MPGRKFAALNTKWTSRLKVTAGSWMLMWRKGLETLTRNPAQVAEWCYWERLARHATLLYSGYNDVQSEEGCNAMKKVIADWTAGSASLEITLDQVLAAQPEQWSIVLLAAFSKALNIADEKRAVEATHEHQAQDDVGTTWNSLRIKQQELDVQIVATLEQTYRSEMSRIQADLMSAQDVDGSLKAKKEALMQKLYGESCRAAKHFWERGVNVMEWSEDEKSDLVWLKLQGLLSSNQPAGHEVQPRFLASANFRVPQMISRREFDMGIALTSNILNQAAYLNSACAAILAPEYPQVGRRKLDMELVTALHNRMVKISVIYFCILDTTCWPHHLNSSTALNTLRTT